MSADESQNLEFLINGEAASSAELALLDEMALQLVEGLPTEIRQGFSFPVETGAEFTVVSSWEELSSGDRSERSAVTLELSRSETATNLIEIGFSPKNELSRLWFGQDEDLIEAIAAAGEILDSPQLTDPTLRALVKHVRKIMVHSTGEVDEDFEIETVQDTANLRHFADVARDLITEVGTVPVANRCYEKLLDGGRTIAVVHKEVADPEVELGPDWEELPTLMVTLVDTEAGVVRAYDKTLDGTVSLEVYESGDYTGSDFSELETTDDMVEDEIVGALMNETGINNQISADDARAIIGGLSYAIMVEDEALTRAETQDDEVWVYPELSFGFNVSKESTVEDIAQATLRELATMAQYFLPELCPDGFPMQPNYSPNNRQLGRVQKYLAQTIAIGNDNLQLKRNRSKVVNIDQAAQAVLDELAITENHPVAQALVQLHNDYSDMFSHTVLSQVTTEVIKQTHWPLLRARLAQQSNQWRAAFTVNA